jgi:hypothetical protein
MKLFAIFSALLILLAAPLFAQDVSAEPPSCDVKVSFGSYGMGTDREAAKSIEAYIDGNASIKKNERHSWGLEGEYDLCLTIPSPAAADAAYTAIKAFVPEFSKKAWTAIARKDGETFKTTWPKN